MAIAEVRNKNGLGCAAVAGMDGQLQVVIAEALVFWSGLKVAVDLGISYIEVQVDCQVFVRYLKSLNWPISLLGLILHDIEYYSSLLDCSYFDFSLKVTNMIAYRFVQFRLSLSSLRLWEDCTPDFISDVLFEDLPH